MMIIPLEEMDEDIDDCYTNPTTEIAEIPPPKFQKDEEKTHTTTTSTEIPLAENEKNGRKNGWTPALLGALFFVLSFALQLVPGIVPRSVQNYYDIPIITPQFSVDWGSAYPVQFEAISTHSTSALPITSLLLGT